MTVLEIPKQFEGKKEFVGSVEVTTLFDFNIKADNEDEAYEKAQKLAQMEHLEFDADPVDMMGMEVQDVEVKK
jgi:hypothetical protein